MNDKALYYPYIHIQDVNWLKATLLLFSEVRRMIPGTFTPNDRRGVRAFAEFLPDGTQLLSPAELWSPRAVEAQNLLAKQLLKDAEDPSFCMKYGSVEARKLTKPGALGFQINPQKLTDRLQHALRESGLAWRPQNFERFDLREEYVELHPQVGQAVMSTLAVAVAMGEGLDIVGDRRSGQLHNCLLQKAPEKIYDAWLHPAALQAAPKQPDAAEVFEFLVGFHCDLSKLTPIKLAALGQNREPLRKLIARLREQASEIPAMDPGPGRVKRFKDLASDVLKEWRRDRKNLTHYWRAFFGDSGLTGTSEKFVEKAADNFASAGEKAATGAAGGVTAAASGGGGIATMATSAVLGASVGLAIGVVFHGMKSYFKMCSDEGDSQYRFLTLMEKSGVVFRSDLGTAPRHT